MEVSLGGGPGQGSEEEAMAVREEETGKHLGPTATWAVGPFGGICSFPTIYPGVEDSA